MHKSFFLLTFVTMKKVLFLVLGLFVAGLAAWATPREYKATTVKIEINSVIPSIVAVTVQAIEPAISRMNYDVGKIARIQNESFGEALPGKYRWYRSAILINSSQEYQRRKLITPDKPIASAMARTPRNSLS